MPQGLETAAAVDALAAALLPEAALGLAADDFFGAGEGPREAGGPAVKDAAAGTASADSSAGASYPAACVRLATCLFA